MVARLNRSCAKDGVIAYQDSEDINTFHYFPARIDAVEKETIISYEVKYYGINAKPYFVDLGNRNYQSVVGSVVSGQAVADITDRQREAVTTEIKRVYKVKEVNLVPLVLEEVTVQPILAKSLVGMGSEGDMTFPERFQIGSQFGFNISSGNSLFAELVGLSGSDASTHNPDIGVNFYGQCELRADPWIAEITADLSQVWEYTRSQFAMEGRIGWVNIANANFDKITQDLQKKGIVKIKYIQGGGGKEFGWQLLNTTKELFEAINKQVVSGEGMFKFEPNPAPQEPPASKDSLGADLLPFSISINMSFASNVFKQKIEYNNRIEFEGNIPVAFNGNMSLALICNSATQKHFYDLQMKQNGCITKEKSDALQKRIRQEVAAKDKKVREYLANVEQGRWTVSQFSEMLALLNTISLTETKASASLEDDSVLPVEAALELLTRREHFIQSLWERPLQHNQHVVHNVFPPDTRKRVTNAKIAPYDGVGLLEMIFPNGKTYVGTATVIDDTHLVTAAHNLFDAGDGGRAATVRFYPGCNGVGNLQPFGVFIANKFYYPADYEHNTGDYSLDYGVVRLSKSLPRNLTRYTPKVAADKDLLSMTMQIAGYPGDKDDRTMWTDSGKLTAVEAKLLKYRISTYRGNSGSAIASKDSNGNWGLYGVHDAGLADCNVGCRVYSTVKRNIDSWVRDTALTDFRTVVVECDATANADLLPA